MYEGLTPWLLGIAAALIAGMAKTGIPGIGILAVPLMVSVFPAKQSVGALLPLLICGDLFAVAYYRKSAQWDRLWELFPCVMIGVILGALALKFMAGAVFKPFLGGLILVLLGVELLRQRMGWQNVPNQKWFVITIGALAGFATTVGNVAGPIMNIYLISKGLYRDHFMGTAAWYFFIFNCAKVPLYIGLGMMTADTVRFDLAMIPLVVVSALMGRWVLGRISQTVFKRVVLVLAAVAALRLLLG